MGLASVLSGVYSRAVDAVVAITIDRTHDEPAYAQIASQIRRAVAAGALSAGTLLPSVRTLAADLGVNLNTVARAYRLLAEQGFVRIRVRSGVEVAPPAPAPAPEVTAAFRAEIDALVARMRQAGLPAAAVRRMVSQKLQELAVLRSESEH